jgi:hypothetical protein
MLSSYGFLHDTLPGTASCCDCAHSISQVLGAPDIVQGQVACVKVRVVGSRQQ